MNIDTFESSLYNKLVKMLQDPNQWTTMSTSIVSTDRSIHLFINELYQTVELLSPEKYQFINTDYAKKLYPITKELFEKKKVLNLMKEFGIDTRLDKLKYLESIAEKETPVQIQKKSQNYWWTPWWKRK